MSIKQASKTLVSRKNKLAGPGYQLKVLNDQNVSGEQIAPFEATLRRFGYETLKPSLPEILQVNVGKKCNQSCAHCHVDAGPDRVEQMSRETMQHCLNVLANHPFKMVDITGGAPELNPDFRWFVRECRALGFRIVNRCNLTIILSNPRYHDLPEFFAANQVELICSLPHFNKLRTDKQRGSGVYEDSIRALKMLNDEGYGQPGTGLILDLVHNPTGAFLPGEQKALESEFRQQLLRKHDIVFNQLYTITNLPISRFLEYLIKSGNVESYMQALLEAFNPHTIPHLMCRNTISVGWDGSLYDCDFNQMLDLRLNASCNHISQFDITKIMNRSVIVNQHCYGCTAGSGSSCGGTLI